MKVPVSEIKIGHKVLVHKRFAEYHSAPEAAGKFLSVVAVQQYENGVYGIQLEGFPETCSRNVELEVECLHDKVAPLVSGGNMCLECAEKNV